MMHNKARISASVGDAFGSIRLPYGSGKWSMYILLPKEGKTVADVLESLDANSWESMCRQSKDVDLELSIPKFSVTDNINLVKPLTAMGFGCMYDGSGIFTRMCKDNRLSVSEMYQKSRIDVDEEGSKMTVVTVSDMDITSPGVTPPDEDELFKDGKFTVDCPFVYIVTEDSSNAVFFVGTFTGK